MLGESPAPSALERVGPYALIEEIGEGAMSVVYRARRGGRDYAVKLMKMAAEDSSVRTSLMFRREAAAVALLDHPCIVRVVEVGEHERRPYLVTELVEGQSLAARLACSPMTDEQALSLAAHLAEALQEVHRHGMVHRDIKPENILVSTDGFPTLIDFGLVVEEEGDELVVGTLRYAAPEQVGVIHAPVGPGADLYSLGVTLFQCLTGRLPLLGDTESDFLQELARSQPPDLRALRPLTRPALAAIIAKLMSKDLDDRYLSAHGLAADLAHIDALDARVRAGGVLELGADDLALVRADQTPLIGRHQEMSRLRSCWRKASRGALVFAQVEGVSGSGKTRLAREFVSMAADQGALVLQGKCQEFETVPFGCLREAVDDYASRIQRQAPEGREVQARRVREAAAGWGPLVKRMSAGIDRLLEDGPDLRALEPEAENQRYYEALAAFLRGLGRAGSVLVLLIDDVQWIDDGTLRVLERLAGSTHGHVLVLSSSRNDVGSNRAMTRYVDAVGQRLAVRIQLGQLPPEAVEALITARLGGRPLDSATVAHLAALTEGNPFGITEYLRALLHSGIVRPSISGWVADPEDLASAALPQDVVQLVVDRLRLLSPDARRLLGVAGLVGGRFELDLATAVAGLSGDTVHRAMAAMLRAGLLEPDLQDTFSFVHDRVREAAVDLLGEGARRDVHQRIAEALDAIDEPSATDLYAMARHYAAGHVERNPRRVAETNLAAGLRALRDHANEEAFEVLDAALPMVERIEAMEEMGPSLLEGLGRACAMTGRHERAMEHLTQAFALARDNQVRFRLQYLLTLTYASQGRNGEALDALYIAFDMLGRPFPKSAVWQLVTMLYLWMLGIFGRWTGLGHGRAAGEERELREVQSRLHYAGSMIALFQGNPFLMVQFVVRDFYNVHFLGATPETAMASAVYGAVLGMFRVKPVMTRYTQLGIEMAEQLGDASALAVCRAYEAVGVKWAGDVERGTVLLDKALPDLHRHAPGSWYTAMMICEQAYSQLHGGHAVAAVKHVRSNRSQLERTNNLMFRYNTVSVQYAEMMATGEVAEAAQLWERLEVDFQPLADTFYVRLARCIARLEVMVDRGETGPELDVEIAEGLDLGGEDYYSNATRMLIGYGRLAQVEAAIPGARRALQHMIVHLSARAVRVPVFACHPLVWRAALARLDRRHGRAERLLTRAQELADFSGNSRASFHIALQRARIARDTGAATMSFFAARALEIAETECWTQRILLVREEFSLVPEATQRRAPGPGTATVAQSRSVEQANRYAKALLQVSLASASSLDPDALAKNALEEVARVLGAERGRFFLFDESNQSLELRASTGDASETISQAVVQRVVDTREPLVLTGASNGEELSSASIITHGLRSILAAPLLMRDHLLGVVYLDSRLAKGMFTEDDVTLLLGVSAHIAIAVQTARSARLEAERTALHRDFELLGAVQTLLLPKQASFSTRGVRGHGFFQPAQQCGGDWWWYGEEPDGSQLILLGDVSGHGAAAAMVTSKVAGAFHTMRALRPDASPPELMDELDRSVRAFGGGFHMSLSLIRIDPQAQEVTWWNAGAPPLFVLSVAGGCSLRVAPGRLIGDGDGFEGGVLTFPFVPGDRILACTDGLLEMRRPNGREFGSKSVARLLERAGEASLEATVARVGAEISAVLEHGPQDDDITFVVVETVPVNA